MEEKIKEIKVAIFDGEIKEVDIAWLINEVESMSTIKTELEYSKELNILAKQEYMSIKEKYDELVSHSSKLNEDIIKITDENRQMKRNGAKE